MFRPITADAALRRHDAVTITRAKRLGWPAVLVKAQSGGRVHKWGVERSGGLRDVGGGVGMPVAEGEQEEQKEGS
eukprot:748196-Hanusia_phi.AAC.1